MIRDTSAQDRVIAAPRRSLSRQLLVWGVPVLAVILLITALPTLGRWAGAERSISGERLRIATVQRGTLVRDVSVQGRIVAAVSPTLYAPAAGTVSLLVAAGDSVQKDAPLARIDSPELSNQLEQARASLQQLEVEVQRQRIASERQKLTTRRAADDAQVALSAAEREWQRAEAAWAKRAMSQVEYLRAKDNLRTAEINARHAQADAGLEIQAVQFELKTREHELERQRLVVADLERRVAELTVRSPVDGVVGTLAISERAVVPANAALLTVVDLSRLEVELDVPEAYADDLGIAMAAEIQYAGSTYPGSLTAISPEVVAGQVRARARFNGELPPGLRQNQRVTTRVLLEEKPNVLLVQRGPFVDSGGGRYAYVIDHDTAQRRAITLGAASLSAVEIVDGLAEGEQVVISSTDEFADAQRILISR